MHFFLSLSLSLEAGFLAHKRNKISQRRCRRYLTFIPGLREGEELGGALPSVSESCGSPVFLFFRGIARVLSTVLGKRFLLFFVATRPIVRAGVSGHVPKRISVTTLVALSTIYLGYAAYIFFFFSGATSSMRLREQGNPCTE